LDPEMIKQVAFELGLAFDAEDFFIKCDSPVTELSSNNRSLPSITIPSVFNTSPIEI